MDVDGRLLAIDVANQHTALALWRGEAAERHWLLATERGRTADEHRLLMSQLLAQAGLVPQDVSACVLGAVVPDVVGPLSAACRDLFGRAPLVVGPGVKTGLKVRTEDPREVGADRVANAVAAKERFGSPVLVLDFATALTVDVVDAAGDYRGALIAPGLAVAAEALASRAAQLSPARLAPPPNVIGTDTESGLRSGLFYGYLGLVEGLVERVRSELGPDTRVVATGEADWLPALLERLSVVDAYEPLLTLDGLRRIHDRQP
jgi:type III pantothenate kinase